MIFDQKFLPHLMRSLKTKNYVLFEHFIVHQPTPEIPLNFLMSKANHPSLIDDIKSFSGIGIINESKTSNSSELHITFHDKTKVQLNLWHTLAQKNIIYLDKEIVLAKKQRSKSEFYMPNIEHLFEFSILYSFLRNEGLSPQYLSYFEDFHFFVKDGLLDFFNEKYLTKFSNLDDLSNFDLGKKEKILEELKSLPANQFFKKINLSIQSLWRATGEQ